MTRTLAFNSAVAIILLSLSSAALAQAVHKQPYAELGSRQIKALSDQQIDDLRAGRGMSFALPAELNGYPGPSHVLENADAIGLSQSQRNRTKALFEAMRSEAVPLGERLIRQETELDRLFAAKTVTPTSLEAATNAVGVTQGRLRAAHLRYHLAMSEVLTPEQAQRYAVVRGYGETASQDGHEHGADAR